MDCQRLFTLVSSSMSEMARLRYEEGEAVDTEAVWEIVMACGNESEVMWV